MKSRNVRPPTSSERLGTDDGRPETGDRSSVPISSPLGRESAYQSLCYVLSERIPLVEWGSFTPNDWELFVQLAKAEGVAPLMYWKLKDAPVEVPSSTFNFLRSIYYQTLAHNTLLFQELEHILEALDEAGIPVIVLKGAALAGRLYEDIGLRPMVDLDLLVKPDNLRKAMREIGKAGYQIEKITYHVVFRGGVNNTSKIELHWSIPTLDGDYSETINWFWESTNPMSRHRLINGDYQTALEFCSSSQLLHLVLHAIVQHRDQQLLLRYYDLYQLLITWSGVFDIDEIYKLAERFGLGNALIKAVDNVEQKFLLSRIKKQFAASNFQTDQYATTSIPKEILFYKDNIVVANSLLSWQIRMFAYIMLLVPNRDYMMRRYHPNPNWLWPLYYPYRWLNIIQVMLRTYLMGNSANSLL